MTKVKLKQKNIEWEILGKLDYKNTNKLSDRQIVDVLLANRGLVTEKQKYEFFNPKLPTEITLNELGINKAQADKAVARIQKAIHNKEKIIIYGDYDADGVCATAILWEALYAQKADVLPYIPGRFDEGYGLNVESINKLKVTYANLKLIITVDNGIVAHTAVEAANSLGIDVIVTDHHQQEKKLPAAHSIVHTTKTGGAAVSWIVAREYRKKTGGKNFGLAKGLDLVAIGTLADQIPLIGPNRSFVKFGLKALNKTKRLGLLALFNKSGITKGDIGTYEVGFVIAPRINAMGRMEHAIESLRLVCTRSVARAEELAHVLTKTNSDRQRIVEEVVLHASARAKEKEWDSLIVLAHESYHEGVIGLAASKLVEEYGRPAIVVAQGAEMSKASARSIPGFNIIKTIRQLDDLIIGGGGHPMAAGFSIDNTNLAAFIKQITKIARPLLTDTILVKKLKVDLETDFSHMTVQLDKEIKKFEPFGIGNPNVLFVTRNAEVLEARTVGRDASHLKLTLGKDDSIIEAIGFGLGEHYFSLLKYPKVDIVYSLDLNVWNGKTSLQLKIKDLKTSQTKMENKNIESQFNKLLSRFVGYAKSQDDAQRITAAWEFIKVAHHGQKRKSGDDFITHPLQTAGYLVEWKMDATSIVVGLLHDTIEHGAANAQDIEDKFGKEVMTLVDGVTSVSKFKLKGSKKEQFVENLRKMFLAMAKDLRVVIVRLAERLHNMQTINYLPEDRKNRYAQDTLEIYAPLAERLGMGQLKNQLEDLAFPVVYPKEYEKVKKESRNYFIKASEIIDSMKKAITKELEKSKINAEVHGRKKGLYSVYRKLERPGIDWNYEKIYDIVALRILVDNVSDCYAALGIVHQLYKPALHLGFSDFIAQPKTNGYRSIHTKVFSNEEQIVEIQIRSYKMHEEAEHGVSAHWAYSEGKKKGLHDDYLAKHGIKSEPDKLAWVKQLAEWQKEIKDSDEFLEAVKFDALKERIFVFSPNGDVYDLPIGATPIDFAFAVHTDLARFIKSVNVNGNIVPLNYKLKNGDTVKIDKLKNKKDYPRDWLNLVMTNTAKREIKKYLRKED